MIAKRISMNNSQKSSAVRLAKYISSTNDTISRVGEIMITNCMETEDVLLASKEIESTQMANVRSKADKTYHLLISFRAGEEPDSAALRHMEKEFSSALGYAEHQRIAVVHRDTDNLHMHIAINKVHPERLTVHQPVRDFRILAEACKRMEQKFSLTLDNHDRRDEAIPAKAGDMESQSGRQSLLSWIRQECLDGCKNASSWIEFHEVLSGHGLVLNTRGNGFVLRTAEGITVKASSIDRSFSKKNLESRFGSFEAVSHQNISSRKKYAQTPLPFHRLDTSELYEQYSRDRRNTESRQSLALAALSKERAQRAALYKQAYALECLAIRRDRRGSNKRVRRDTAKLEYRTRMVQLRKEMQERRKSVYADNPRLTWLDWLKAEAEKSNTTAVETLRARAFGLAKKFNPPAITGDRIAPGTTVENIPIDTVTKKGTVLYQVNQEIVRDEGTSFAVSRETGIDTTIMALKMAQKRFGNTLTITGDPDFKQKIIDAAVAGNLRITFADARMELKRKTRMESRNPSRSVEKQDGLQR